MLGAIADGTLCAQPCWPGAHMALGLWAAPNARTLGPSQVKDEEGGRDGLIPVLFSCLTVNV